MLHGKEAPVDAKERQQVRDVIAIYQAEHAKLEEALKEYAATARRKLLVEETIMRLRMSIGEEGPIKAMPSVPSSVNPETDPLWKGIRQILLDLKRPATAPDITRMLAQRGWKLTRNGREIVRSTMLRKPDTFRKVGDGLYGLVEPDKEVETRKMVIA